jgi:hypothetical protein
MTDAELWQMMRTSAAAKNARRFHANKRGYTIYMDRLGINLDHDNVQWIDKPAPNQWLAVPFTSAGLYLGEYHIDQDDKPDWHAVVTVDKPDTDDGDVRITSVVITGESLDTTALPLSEIKRALFQVGGVLGTWETSRNENSDQIFTFQKIAIAADGQPIRPDELRGTKQRAGMKSPETFAKVLQLIERHQQLKLTNKTDKTLREYVANGTGYSITNIQKLITAARKWAAENNQGTP